jgi:hypothetical protein
MAVGASSSQLIKSIKSPLTFFALALLIQESFLGSAIWSGKLDKDVQFAALFSGVFICVLVVILVFVLTWHRQPNLVEERAYATPSPEVGSRKPKNPKKPRIKKKPAQHEEMKDIQK